jgi:lysyl-tRNA synthetase, class II
MSDPALPDSPQDEQAEAAQESRVVAARRDKAARMREAGINLYVQRYDPTHTSDIVRRDQEALIASAGPVRMAGRVLLHRVMGKAGFLTFQDDTGRFQAYIKKDVTEPAGFDLFKENLDVGDIVGIEGPIFITKKGELTIQANRLELLTKSLRPLPEKWHGLKDIEQRYRQRYVDLIVNEPSQATFRLRSRMISAIRRQLDERGYMEVETPMMQSIFGGATARPFRTHMNSLDLDLYLRIAPELFLKRLLVGGFEKVYEINRNFRNEGLSTRHNPEFTMLELYTAYWDYRQTMDLTEALFRDTAADVLGDTTLSYQGREVDLGAPFRREKMLDLVAADLGLDAAHGLRWGGASVGELVASLEAGGAKLGDLKAGMLEKDSADEAQVLLFEELVEPKIVQPTFVYDFPKSQCPLAKSAENDPATAERFELFCCGLELANAYSELNDPGEQLARFEEQVQRRAAGDMEAMAEVDHDYIHALEYGMPPASGLGIGIDRMVMLFTDSPAIRDVILFPLMRPSARS